MQNLHVAAARSHLPERRPVGRRRAQTGLPSQHHQLKTLPHTARAPQHIAMCVAHPRRENRPAPCISSQQARTMLNMFALTSRIGCHRGRGRHRRVCHRRGRHRRGHGRHRRTCDRRNTCDRHRRSTFRRDRHSTCRSDHACASTACEQTVIRTGVCCRSCQMRRKQRSAHHVLCATAARWEC